MKLLLGKENGLGLFYREQKNSPDPFSLLIRLLRVREASRRSRTNRTLWPCNRYSEWCVVAERRPTVAQPFKAGTPFGKEKGCMSFFIENGNGF